MGIGGWFAFSGGRGNGRGAEPPLRGAGGDRIWAGDRDRRTIHRHRHVRGWASTPAPALPPAAREHRALPLPAGEDNRGETVPPSSSPLPLVRSAAPSKTTASIVDLYKLLGVEDFGAGPEPPPTQWPMPRIAWSMAGLLRLPAGLCTLSWFSLPCTVMTAWTRSGDGGGVGDAYPRVQGRHDL